MAAQSRSPGRKVVRHLGQNTDGVRQVPCGRVGCRRACLHPGWLTKHRNMLRLMGAGFRTVGGGRYRLGKGVNQNELWVRTGGINVNLEFSTETEMELSTSMKPAGLLGETADSRVGAGKVQGEPRSPDCAKSKCVLKP